MELIYENSLRSEEDVRDFRLEGEAALSFPMGRMRMENKLDAGEGQKSNFVLWCPETFPSDIFVTWDFWPIREPGLCILFFSAKGRNGEDLFDERLAARTGVYDEYHHGDIDAYHVSYFRRKWDEERQFHTCNLRKSYGFHLVTQGADPIPGVADAKGPYRIGLRKQGGSIDFSVNDLTVFQWQDDGQSFGPILGEGRIGFRQMAPLIAEYANLKVYRL
ncbi:YesU family protein [Paenibacillus sp. TRM 82003]|nr:YesU family protein [Paenibacillus sp. TRM 82003]